MADCSCAGCIYSLDSYSGEICTKNTHGWECVHAEISHDNVPNGYISISDGKVYPSQVIECLLRKEKRAIKAPIVTEADLML